MISKNILRPAALQPQRADGAADLLPEGLKVP
jgi:hypothetical protein